MKLRNSDLDEADIGVITPYRQQVLMLKKALDSLELPDVKVGTVEQFQGQEREVIIISTVRSTVKHNEFDRAHNLGFLSNPRRFNVAVTRAKSLLIIIGNPHIIYKDPHWDKLPRYCADNGSYEGCPLPLSEKYTVPHKYDAYNGQADVPNQYSGEVEWGDQVRQQYNNEAEWNKTGQYQYSNEPEWGEVPKQYSDDVEWDETVHDEYSKEAEWNEVPKHYYNKVEWEGKCQYPYSKEGKWGREVGKQYSHEAERDETVPQQYSNNEAGWGKEVPNQYDSEFERGNGSSKYKSSAVESKSNPSPNGVELADGERMPHSKVWSNGMALLSNQPDGMCDT